MNATSQAALDRALAKLHAAIESLPEDQRVQATARVKAQAKQVRHENVVCEQLDWRVIEPEHSARELACKEFNPDAREAAAQAVSERNETTIEVFKPVNVPVLAFPMLMCMGCTLDKPCTYESVVAGSQMGCCADCERDGWLDAKNRRTRFVQVERVAIDAIARNGVVVGRA